MESGGKIYLSLGTFLRFVSVITKKSSFSPTRYKLITALCGMRTSRQGAVPLSFLNETTANLGI